jgi:hypothetical protein
MGAADSKIGITSHPAIRLGTYQNGYSRNSHNACFDRVYFGSSTEIAALEKAAKNKFDWLIERDGRGVSEWISGQTVAMIEKEIDVLVEGYKFKITKVPKKYCPLTVDNMEAFLTAYELETHVRAKKQI